MDIPENSNENHSRFHSFSIRQRLVDANGNFDNQVMLIEDGSLTTGNGLFSDASPVLSHALTQMDEWLTNLSSLGTHRASLKQIQRAMPSDLVDACFTKKGTVKIAQLQVYQRDTTCNQLYPAFSSPRLVAGEPLANNVLKCRLKPTSLHEYKATFTTTESRTAFAATRWRASIKADGWHLAVLLRTHIGRRRISPSPPVSAVSNRRAGECSVTRRTAAPTNGGFRCTPPALQRASARASDGSTAAAALLGRAPHRLPAQKFEEYVL